jgi:hypothetical protein
MGTAQLISLAVAAVLAVAYVVKRRARLSHEDDD